MKHECKLLQHTGKSIIAYPYTLLREGLVRILQERGFEVVGHTDNIHQLCQMISQFNPDIILIDWELLETHWEAISHVIKDHKKGAIVVLAKPGYPITSLASMGRIARGYLSLDLSPVEFSQAMDLVSNGGVVLSRGMAETLMGNFGANQLPQDGKLSEREQEVLKLVAQGATNSEIAEELILSENTVKVHVRSMLNKLNLRNRQQVAAYAVQKGINTVSERDDVMV